MKRHWNLLLYAGFLLALAAFLSYFAFFARFPITRDFPWVSLLLFAVALGMLGTGLSRAFRRPEVYRGKITGPILTTLSVALMGFFLFSNFWFSRQVPASKGAPQVGQRAPDFTLPDIRRNPVTLSKLWGDAEAGQAADKRGRWVLLVFYRGYW